ncbi:LuxR C-terminal-related transcriptional regulator [Streptomyces chrestomyceticus]|uniref:LuxR C-terminal-related transcriptional regulator n=1 Tax=Streptomyces chrestomyceticus TaxID=68185 RepID=UPI0037A616B2
MAFGSARPPGGRLPADVTSFIGREAELDALSGLLGRARLVTVLGPGGVGKTRLALRAAAQAAGNYAHGARCVELSDLRDPSLLPQAVADALGVAVQASRPPLGALTAYLAECELLLVLDTCEHLLDACAALTGPLLARSPGLTVLATSRQALDVPGEHVLPVPPLPLPAPDAAGDGDALTLLVQRAAAVAPGFALTDANRAQAAALCHRLDGLPLAIELAAVRLRALPLDRLPAQAGDTFALLGPGRSTSPARHRTLRAAVDWSYGLCTPAERLLWARLSVFAGPFGLTAADAVATDADLPAPALLTALVGLTEKSVVQRLDERRDRYRLPALLREYGAERLREREGREACRRRFVAHYRAQLVDFSAEFATPAQLARYRALAAERQNLYAALEYAAAVGGLQELTAVMWAYWLCAGQPAEATVWMTRALRERREPSQDRVMTLAWCSMFTGNQGDRAGASALAAEAVATADRLRDARASAWAALAASAARFHDGGPSHGPVLVRAAGTLMHQAGDRTGRRIAALHLSFAHLLAGQPAATLDTARTTLELLGEDGTKPVDQGSQGSQDDSTECYIHGSQLSTCGLAHLMLGAPAEAADALRRAVLLKGCLEDVLGVASATELLAWLAADEGRARRAARLFGATAALWRRVGPHPMVGNAQLQALHDAYERQARTALGARRFAALAAEGASLTLAQAVRYAAEDGRPASGTGRRALTARAAPASAALTRREREVAGLVAAGLSNRRIAERLVISKRTVDAHVEHILGKLGYASRAQITALLREEGAPGAGGEG